MVGRKPRKKKQRVLGSHQRCWLWGRHAVLETLRARRWTPLEVHWDPQLVPEAITAEIQTLAADLGIKQLFESDAARLVELCHANDHQGLLLKLPPYPYASLESIKQDIQRQQASGTAPFLVMLAGIQDPHNFGAILRSAEVLGATGIVVPVAGQADVSPQVVRSAAGAANFLNIAQVGSLVDAAREFKSLQVQVVGASEKATLAPDQINFCSGTLLVIGNEGTGLGPELLKVCDVLVSIPQVGQIQSLNAAVATGILCYEVQRQRLRNLHDA